MVAIVRVDIRELKNVINFAREVPKNVTREVDGTNTRFMKALRKSAKLRAPRDTRALADSIKLEPVQKSKNTKIWKLVVDAPYASFQEHGFKPHYAPISGSRRMAPGVYFVKKFTPFLEPALQHNLKTFDKKLNAAVDRAMK